MKGFVALGENVFGVCSTFKKVELTLFFGVKVIKFGVHFFDQLFLDGGAASGVGLQTGFKIGKVFQFKGGGYGLNDFVHRGGFGTAAVPVPAFDSGTGVGVRVVCHCVSAFLAEDQSGEGVFQGETFFRWWVGFGLCLGGIKKLNGDDGRMFAFGNDDFGRVGCFDGVGDDLTVLHGFFAVCCFEENIADIMLIGKHGTDGTFFPDFAFVGLDAKTIEMPGDLQESLVFVDIELKGQQDGGSIGVWFKRTIAVLCNLVVTERRNVADVATTLDRCDSSTHQDFFGVL